MLTTDTGPTSTTQPQSACTMTKPFTLNLDKPESYLEAQAKRNPKIHHSCKHIEMIKILVKK